MKIEDHMIGLSNPISATNPNTTQDNLYTNLLKNRIPGETNCRQNAIINFLSCQIISKTPDLLKNKRNDNGQVNNKSDYDGLLLKHWIEIFNFPGATSTDTFSKIDDIVEDKPQSLIVHVVTNNLINDVNLLNNVKTIVKKTKKKAFNTAISFSNIIIRKDRNNLNKSRADTNSRLKNFCEQKNIGLIDNENLKENQLGLKKLHLNRKGNTLFAKNSLNFIEGKWNFRSERDVFTEENGASDDSTILQSDVKNFLKNIRISNINNMIFRHLNVSSLRNKFDIFR